MKGITKVLAAILGAAGLAALGADLAAAKGGGGGGTPPPQADTGLIHYSDITAGSWYTINPDGTGKTSFTAVAETTSTRGGSFGRGVPSVALHGNDRWWLQWKEVAAHTMSGTFEMSAGGTTYTLPDFPQVELYATAQSSGVSYRLTDGATYETIDSTAWLVELIEPDMYWGDAQAQTGLSMYALAAWGNRGTLKDGKVSYCGRRWTRSVVRDSGGNVVRDGDGNPTFTTWLLTDPGHYALSIDPDALSSHTPGKPSVFASLFFAGGANNPWLMNSQGSWSRDGSRFAYLYRDPESLYVCNADGSNPTRITDGYNPQWSPTEDRILFVFRWQIHLINPDGTGLTTLVADPPDPKTKWLLVDSPSWSPSGTWVMYRYMQQQSNSDYASIYRIPAAGGTSVFVVKQDGFLALYPTFWR